MFTLLFVVVIVVVIVVVVVREQEAAVSIAAEGSYSSLAAQVSECLAHTVTRDVIYFKTAGKPASTSGKTWI